jgi:hypothetical protein
LVRRYGAGQAKARCCCKVDRGRHCGSGQTQRPGFGGVVAVEPQGGLQLVPPALGRQLIDEPNARLGHTGVEGRPGDESANRRLQGRGDMYVGVAGSVEKLLLAHEKSLELHWRWRQGTRSRGRATRSALESARVVSSWVCSSGSDGSQPSVSVLGDPQARLVGSLQPDHQVTVGSSPPGSGSPKRIRMALLARPRTASWRTH